MRQSRAASLSVLAFGFVLGIVSLGWPQPLGAQAAAPPSASIDMVIQYDVPMKTRDSFAPRHTATPREVTSEYSMLRSIFGSYDHFSFPVAGSSAMTRLKGVER